MDQAWPWLLAWLCERWNKMDFDVKKIIKKLSFSRGEEKNFSAEKEDLKEHKEAASKEKDKRKSSGLSFNTGKNPLQEKMDQVNYKMPKAKKPASKDKKIKKDDKEGKKEKTPKRTETKSKKKKEKEVKTKELAGNKEEEEKKPTKTSITEKLRLGDAWRAPKIIKTNLVKGEITTFIDWNKNVHELAVACGVAAGVIVFWFLGLVIMGMGIENQGRLLEGDIEVLKAQIITAQDEVVEIDKFQEKLKHTKVLMDNHVYFTNYFDFLEENLLPESRLSPEVNLTPSGIFTYSVTTNSHKSRIDQITLLKSLPEVLSVESDSATMSVSVDEETEKESVAVTYSLDVVLDTNIFRENKTE